MHKYCRIPQASTAERCNYESDGEDQALVGRHKVGDRADVNTKRPSVQFGGKAFQQQRSSCNTQL